MNAWRKTNSTERKVKTIAMDITQKNLYARAQREKPQWRGQELFSGLILLLLLFFSFWKERSANTIQPSSIYRCKERRWYRRVHNGWFVKRFFQFLDSWLFIHDMSNYHCWWCQASLTACSLSSFLQFKQDSVPANLLDSWQEIYQDAQGYV